MAESSDVPAMPPRQGPQEFEKVLDRKSGEVASFATPHLTPLDRFQHLLHANPTAAPILVLVVSCALFGLLANNFFSVLNLSFIIQQVTVIGILGAAQTLVILTAGIELSVAAVMVLSYMVMARLAVEGGIPTPFAILMGLAVGLACGLFNGSLATRVRILPVAATILAWVVLIQAGLPFIYAVAAGFVIGLAAGLLRFGPSLETRLPPFIVTLGAWSIFFAVNLWFAENQTVRSQDIDAAAGTLKLFGERVTLFGAQFTYGSFLMLAIFGALWYLLNWTGWGRAVYAVGDDKEAAELSGINTDRILLSVYGLSGFLCAVAGWAAIGRVGSAAPQSFYEGNLDAITAVVIGGTSLFGGRGAIFGTLFGALIVGVFRSGLKLAGFDPLWQTFSVGVLIIVAVAMDQWIRRVSK
ncbi:MAG TPA: ABC transporter permease [Paracoccaceae bacterium]|nr:ABC transporter permease [Paracoccaceae bacterium]